MLFNAIRERINKLFTAYLVAPCSRFGNTSKISGLSIGGWFSLFSLEGCTNWIFYCFVNMITYTCPCSSQLNKKGILQSASTYLVPMVHNAPRHPTAGSMVGILCPAGDRQYCTIADTFQYLVDRGEQ